MNKTKSMQARDMKLNKLRYSNAESTPRKFQGCAYIYTQIMGWQRRLFDQLRNWEKNQILDKNLTLSKPRRVVYQFKQKFKPYAVIGSF